MTSTDYPTSLERLQNILNELRAKCPWDQKQTLESLQPQTIEELYELVDVIQDKNWNGIKEELGDLLLHILFYAKIAQESNAFDISDVIQSISDKLVNRHPHIYGAVQVKDAEEVKKNWEQIKKQEGKKSVLTGVPKSLPPMSKAVVIQRKARNAGFDWEENTQVLEKLKEEVNELEQAINLKDKAEIEAEFGDVFFSMMNLARFIGVDPEKSLEACNQKFIQRFQMMEQLAAERNLKLGAMKLMEMEALWQESKSILKSIS